MAKWKKTRLLEAVALGNEETVNELLRSGVSPNVSNAIGVTPLMVAARIDNKNMVRLLVSYGADIDAYDFLDRSALRYAMKYGSKQGLLSLIDAYIEG